MVIIEPDGTGGMIHFAQMLSAAVAELGVDVTLVTATDYELAHIPRQFTVSPKFALWTRMPAVASSSTNGFPAGLYRRLFRRTWRAWRLFTEMWRITGEVGRSSPDWVVVRPFPVPAHNWLLKRLKKGGSTLMEICHEFESRDTSHKAVALIEQAMNGAGSTAVDARLFLSDKIRERYARLYPHFPPSRMFVIPHGDGELFRLVAANESDVYHRYSIDPGDIVILFFGNLRPSKGVEDLLEAFASASRPDSAKLVVAGYPGRDVDRGSLATLAESLEITDRVIFALAYVPLADVGPMMSRARFLVLPYRSATQSGPLHIAMTFNCPVIATRTGGMEDVVQDGVTGLLVEPGDVNGLARGIERLLWDDELVAAMGHAIGERAVAHRWSVLADAVARAAGSSGSNGTG